MEEIVTEAGRPLYRLFYYFIRVLLWLAWDLSVQIIGWSIGWFMLRVMTIGYFPKYRWSEQGKAPLWLALAIEFFGLSILGLLTMGLYQLAFQ